VAETINELALRHGLEAGDVRRALCGITKAADTGEDWTSRERRHSFMSSLSDNEIPIEAIADLCGRPCRLRGSEPLHLGQMTVPASILSSGSRTDTGGERPSRRTPTRPTAKGLGCASSW
jgi:hypothetical protein